MEAPQQVTVGHKFAVQISLTEKLVTPDVNIVDGTTTERGELVLPLALIDVVLSAPGFKFRHGHNTGTMTLRRYGDSTPALFFLTAKKKDVTNFPILRTLYATLWHRGAYLAKISRDIRVMTKDSSTPPLPPDTAISPLPAPTGRVLNAIPPDLTVYILDESSPYGLETSEVIIDSPYLQTSLSRFSFPKGFKDWLEQQYLEIATDGGRGIRPAADEAGSNLERRSSRLRGFGRELYRRFAPEAFRKAFWRLVDRLGPSFRTIQIYSSNPVLPWELLRPTRNDGSDERGFLGIEFNVARWHVSTGTTQFDRPPRSLSLEELVVIAPQYEGALSLPNQEQELRTLETLEGYRRVPGSLGSLRSLFGGFPQGIVHFAGHGEIEVSSSDQPSYAIRLEDGLLDLMTWRGLITTRSEHHPLFFFNACEVAQAHRVANFVDGWAPAVLEAGASGYIGALWPVGDHSSAEFGAQFYGRLAARLRTGLPANISNILRETRAQYLENGDPTFLAYVFYGDPYLLLRGRNRPAG